MTIRNQFHDFHHFLLHLALDFLNRKMQDEGLDTQTTKNEDFYGALIHHLSLVRNKRCLMAYM